MRLTLLRHGLIGFAALSISATAHAEPNNQTVGSQAFRDMLDCRQVQDATQRLACFDRQAAIVAGAKERQEIVVTDKAEIRQTRRKLFGFALPSSSVLGSDDSSAESSRLETQVASARRNRDGGWIVQLSEGGTWEQIDSRMLALSPKNGQKAIVTKGVLGSYFVSIDGQPAIKMRRVQ